MASMNYCFTVCRAAEEKVQRDTHANTTSAAIDVPTSSPSSSPSSLGAYFFGRFFSFGLTPPVSTSSIQNSFIVKAAHFNDMDDNLFE